MVFYNNNRVDQVFYNNANIVAIGQGNNTPALVYNNAATNAQLQAIGGNTNIITGFEIVNFNTLGIDNIDLRVPFTGATVYYNRTRNNCLIESTTKDMTIYNLIDYGFCKTNFAPLSLNSLTVYDTGSSSNPTGYYTAKYVGCYARHGGSALARWYATENLTGRPLGRTPGYGNMAAGNVLNLNGASCSFGKYSTWTPDQLNITGATTAYLYNFNGGAYWQSDGGLRVLSGVTNAYLQNCRNICTVNANKVFVNASSNFNYINGNYVQVNNSSGYYNITANNLYIMDNIRDGNITANVNSIGIINITNSNLNMVVTNYSPVIYNITLNDCYGKITKQGPQPSLGETYFGSVNTTADMLVEYINNNTSTFSQNGEQVYFFPKVIQNGSVPAFFNFKADNLGSNIYYSSDYNDTNLAITSLNIFKYSSSIFTYKNSAFIGYRKTLLSTPNTSAQLPEFENLQCLKYNEYNSDYNERVDTWYTFTNGQYFDVYSNANNLTLCHNFKIRPELNIATPISSPIELLASPTFNGSGTFYLSCGGAFHQFKQINGYWYFLNGLGKIGRPGNTSGVITNNFIIDANTPALFIESNLDNRYYRNYRANGTFRANISSFFVDNTTNGNYMFDMFKNGWRPAYNFGQNVTAVFQNVQYSQMDIYASNNVHFCYVTHWGSSPKRYSILYSPLGANNAFQKIPFVTFYRTVSTWFASATNAINTSGVQANGSYYNNTAQVNCFNNVSLVGCANVRLAGYKNFNYYAKGSIEDNACCSSALENCTSVVCNVQYTDFYLYQGSNISGNFFNSNVYCIGLNNSVLNLHNCTYTNDGCTNVTFISN